MGPMASQITSLTIVYTTVYSGPDQRKHQSSASLVFVRGIHRSPVNSPHKWPGNAENVSIWWRHHGLRFASNRYFLTAIRFKAWISNHIHIKQWDRLHIHALTSTGFNSTVIEVKTWASYQIRKLWDAHAPGMSGTFSLAADSKGNR